MPIVYVDPAGLEGLFDNSDWQYHLGPPVVPMPAPTTPPNTSLTDPVGPLPAGMETALDALAKRNNWTSDQKAAARQWLEDFLANAKNAPKPRGVDRCWKWVQPVMAGPGPPSTDIEVQLRGWYYPYHWLPYIGYLTHARLPLISSARAAT